MPPPRLEPASELPDPAAPELGRGWGVKTRPPNQVEILPRFTGSVIPEGSLQTVFQEKVDAQEQRETTFQSPRMKRASPTMHPNAWLPPPPGVTCAEPGPRRS